MRVRYHTARMFADRRVVRKKPSLNEVRPEMPKQFLLILSAAAVGLVVACGKSESPISPSSAVSTTNALPDGSTLKIDAPRLISPTNGVQIQRGDTFTVTLENVRGRYATFPVTYELEVRNSATGAVVATASFPAAGGSTTSFAVSAANLAFETNHSWRVRAAYLHGRGPWSANGTFVSGKRAFLNPQTGEVFDPLTDGEAGGTVGVRRGGQFLQGQGWQTVSRDDGIDYNIPTCPDCVVEFDMTGIGDGLGQPHDDKWLSMGDGALFGDFNAFRDQDWKMTLEQRADGDGTGMKLIWRNGDAGDGDPGDHTGKQDPGPDWQENVKYHFVFDWNPRGFRISINGELWFEDTFDEPYAPPNHRVSIGCYPRGETRRDAIYSNFQIKPRR
jgi:hypothetical protein